MARILVVDDDTDILKLADRILSSAGHTVLLAEDALRAIDWLTQFEFDLMISDANMPHYSGFDLINTIRNNPKYNGLGIVMLTGLRERRDVERALAVGVDDYIVKPLDPMLLVEKVNSLFEKRPAQQYHEIQLSPSQSAGAVRRPIKVQSISEMGIRIVSESPLKVGQLLDLDAEVFRILDIDPPALKVLSVDTDATTGHYRAHVIFFGAREAMLQKIRRWLYTHGASQKAA